MHLKVWRNQVFVGYIKSVNYNNGSYSLTKDVNHAKTYNTEISLMNDIDYCSRVSKEFSVFTY